MSIFARNANVAFAVLCRPTVAKLEDARSRLLRIVNVVRTLHPFDCHKCRLFRARSIYTLAPAIQSCPGPSANTPTRYFTPRTIGLRFTSPYSTSDSENDEDVMKSTTDHHQPSQEKPLQRIIYPTHPIPKIYPRSKLNKNLNWHNTKAKNPGSGRVAGDDDEHIDDLRLSHQDNMFGDTDLMKNTVNNRLGSKHQYDRTFINNRRKMGDSRSLPDYNYGLAGLGKKSRAHFKRKQVSSPHIEGDALFGLFPVLLAMQCGRRHLYHLYVKSSLMASGRPLIERILRLAEEKGVGVEACSQHTLDALSSTRPHQGVCLDASKLHYEDLENLPRSPADKQAIWLVLDSIVDPMNFGAILRSSYYLGVDQVLAVKKNACKLSPVVSKASAGSLELIPIYAIPDLMKFIQQQKSDGWHVLGTTGPGTIRTLEPICVQDIHLITNTILLLGSEGWGLSEEVMSLCDHLITIPSGHADDVALESLNVSVATGILLYQLLSRRPK